MRSMTNSNMEVSIGAIQDTYEQVMKSPNISSTQQGILHVQV